MKCAVCQRRVHERDDGPLDSSSSIEVAAEHGKVGRDRRVCFLCMNDYNAYQALMAMWRDA